MVKKLNILLLILFLVTFQLSILGQSITVGDSLVIPSIKKVTSEIYKNADKTHFYLTKEQLRNRLATSTTITAKTFKEKINRIIAVSTVEEGMLSTEWYFDEGKVIYVYETLEYFENEKNPQATYKNFKDITAKEVRYYFVNEELKCQKYIGTEASNSNEVKQILEDGKAIYNFVSNKLNNLNCSCCEEPYKQFDFWEGEWYVLGVKGNKLGDNTISKTEANCILKENWKGAKGGTGTSINFYNKADATWNQTWVSNTGNVLRLKGAFINGKMILKSELIKGKKATYYNQVTWTPNQDGTVTQLWELYDKNEVLLRTLFKGIYHRKVK